MIEEINDDTMYVLIAPDGVIQLSTLAPDEAMCIAVINLWADSGYGKTYQKMVEMGFKILPVVVTVKKLT